MRRRTGGAARRPLCALRPRFAPCVPALRPESPLCAPCGPRACPVLEHLTEAPRTACACLRWLGAAALPCDIETFVGPLLLGREQAATLAGLGVRARRAVRDCCSLPWPPRGTSCPAQTYPVLICTLMSQHHRRRCAPRLRTPPAPAGPVSRELIIDLLLYTMPRSRPPLLVPSAPLYHRRDFVCFARRPQQPLPGGLRRAPQGHAFGEKRGR